MNAPANMPVKAPRKSKRTSVMLRATVFARDTGKATEHRVVNVSDTGLCIGQAEHLKPDHIVVVTIGAVEHAPADIIWVDSGLAGLEFHQPIDVAAARNRTKSAGAAIAPAAGWMAELSSPYRG